MLAGRKFLEIKINPNIYPKKVPFWFTEIPFWFIEIPILFIEISF